MNKRATTAAPMAMASLVIAFAGCPGPAVHVPGKVKDVSLVVKLAALDDAELSAIGSFTLTIIKDGTTSQTVPLNFSASARSLSFLPNAPELPTTGKLAFTLQAADLQGAAVKIGGASGTLDLDLVPAGSAAQLFALVGRIGAPAPLDPALASPPDHVVAVGTGIFATHGVALEWIDLAAGRHCKSGDAGCNFGPAPSTIENVVSLDAFAPGCTGHGGALVLGGAPAGAMLFDPAGLDGDGALTPLSISTGSHVNGALFATKDCRVFAVAGEGSTSIDVIDFSSGTAEASTSGGAAVVGPAVAALDNALDEHVLVGGVSDVTAPTPSSTAVLVTPSQTGAALCTSNDAGCNGQPSTMQCARATPAAARIDDGTDQSPTLILGGVCAAPSIAEMLVSSPDAPFTRFVAVDSQPITARASGLALHAFGKNTLLIAGGATAAFETFTLSSIDAAAGAHGTFAALHDLASPRDGPAFFEIGGAIVVAGGGTGKLEVIVPPFGAP